MYTTQYDNERTRQIHHARGMDRAPAKKARGHEAVLSAIQGQGQTIVIEKCDGSVIAGPLVAFDKYTITVSCPGAVVGSVRRRVIFKHDISEFYSETAATQGA